MAAVPDRRRVRAARPRLLRQRLRARVDRLARRLRPALRRIRPAAAAAHDLLRRELGGLPAVEGHLRRAAGRHGRVGGGHRRHPQHADDRVHARLPAVDELAADADRVRGVPPRRVRDPQGEPAHQARQRDGAGAHRLARPRARGGDRRASHRQGVRRRGLREPPAAHRVRPPALGVGQAVGGTRARHADQPADHLRGGRRDPLGRDPPERGGAVRTRRLHHLHLRAAQPDEPGQDAVQRHGHDPARNDGGRERVRADRRDRRGGPRHRRGRTGRGRDPLRGRDDALRRGRHAGAGRTSTSRSRRGSRSRWWARAAAARRRSST